MKNGWQLLPLLLISSATATAQIPSVPSFGTQNVITPPDRSSQPAGIPAATVAGPPIAANRRARALTGTPVSFHRSTPHPAVARVMTKDDEGMSLGTGTLVATRDKMGLMITNWHVIRDGKEILVRFPNGFQSPARVLKADENWDLAALLIWRPEVAPVPVAEIVPRQGDSLTIAGYGAGQYRAATGRCTQYVSPGEHFPYEMLELSTQARQGDSGGPIFNTQGQLAGVLFGAGSGTTSGSHCGRVRRFLASVLPAAAPLPAQTPGRPGTALAQQQAQPPLKPLPQTMPAAPPASALATGPATPDFQPLTTPLTAHAPINARPPALEKQQSGFFANRSNDGQSPVRELVTSTPQPIPQPASSRPAATTNGQPDWRDLVGHSFLEQLKSFFAGIGLLTVLALSMRRPRRKE